MVNRAVQQGGGAQPAPKPSGSTPAAAPSATSATAAAPVCQKCNGTQRVQFTEKVRGHKSVGPCECVKA